MAVSTLRPAVGKRRPAAATATSTGVCTDAKPQICDRHRPAVSTEFILWACVWRACQFNRRAHRLHWRHDFSAYFGDLWLGCQHVKPRGSPNQARALLIGKALMDLPARAHVHMRRRHGRGSAAPASMRLVTRCGWAACWVLSAVLREVAAKYYALMTIR